MEGKVTVVGRTKILRARAGEITLPKIVGFAFGSGGSNGSTVLSPGETLKNEFLRKAVDGHTLKTNENKCEYYCTLNGSEANGKSMIITFHCSRKISFTRSSLTTWKTGAVAMA